MNTQPLLYLQRPGGSLPSLPAAVLLLCFSGAATAVLSVAMLRYDARRSRSGSDVTAAKATGVARPIQHFTSLVKGAESSQRAFLWREERANFTARNRAWVNVVMLSLVVTFTVSLPRAP